MDFRNLSWMDLDDARIGQKNAIDTILRNASEGKRTTGIILPTRYGKSDVIRIASTILFSEKMAAINLVVTPNSFLRDQLVDEKKMRACFSRYRIVNPNITSYINMEELKYKQTSYGLDFAPNNEFLISITVQMLTYYENEFYDWIDSVFHRTGLPVYVHFDEIQMASDTNRWGNIMKNLVDKGASIIGYTATAYRGDEERIVGFDYKMRGSEPITVTSTQTDSHNPDLVQISYYSGYREYYELKADYYHSFKQAYDEGVLCFISRQTVDADVQKIYETAKPLRLSEMQKTETRQILGKLVRDKDFIAEMVREGVEKLHYVRSMRPEYQNAQMIVFCQNDEADYKPNEHAKQIKNTIQKNDANLKVVIATQAVEENKASKKARQLIKDFVRGDGDVIVVKNMGGVGLDADSLKVVIDLSSIRTSANCVQRWNRATTLWATIRVAHLVTPADVLSEQIFTDFIDVEGGAVNDVVELEKELTKVREESLSPAFSIDLPLRGKADDTKGNIAVLEMLDLAYKVLESFPILVETLTVPEIAEQAKKLNIKSSIDFTMPIESSAYVQKAKDQITLITRRAASFRLKRSRGSGYQGKGGKDTDFQKVMTQIWKQIHNYANVRTEYKKISDRQEIDRYLQATAVVCKKFLENQD